MNKNPSEVSGNYGLFKHGNQVAFIYFSQITNDIHAHRMWC